MALLLLAPTVETQKKFVLSRLTAKNPEGSPDVLWVVGDPTITIEMVRDLITWTQTSPFVEPVKVAIVLEAQHLTPQAQNALLKTLEEPPAKVELILTAPHEFGLLPTIRSRTTVISLNQTFQPKVEKQFPFPQSIYEAIEKAEELSKEREEAIAWAEHLLAELRTDLLANPSDTRQQRSVKKLMQTIGNLKRNVNTKLALESFFFDFLQR